MQVKSCCSTCGAVAAAGTASQRRGHGRNARGRETNAGVCAAQLQDGWRDTTHTLPIIGCCLPPAPRAQLLMHAVNKAVVQQHTRETGTQPYQTAAAPPAVQAKEPASRIRSVTVAEMVCLYFAPSWFCPLARHVMTDHHPPVCDAVASITVRRVPLSAWSSCTTSCHRTRCWRGASWGRIARSGRRCSLCPCPCSWVES